MGRSREQCAGLRESLGKGPVVGLAMHLRKQRQHVWLKQDQGRGVWHPMEQDLQGGGFSWGVAGSGIAHVPVDPMSLGSPQSPRPGHLRVYGPALPVCMSWVREGPSLTCFPSMKCAHCPHRSLDVRAQCGTSACEMPG